MNIFILLFKFSIPCLLYLLYMFTDFSESLVKMPGRRFSIPRHQRIDSAEPVTNPCQLEFCPPLFFPSYLHCHVIIYTTKCWKDEGCRVLGCWDYRHGYVQLSVYKLSSYSFFPTFASTIIPNPPIICSLAPTEGSRYCLGCALTLQFGLGNHLYC